MLSTTLAPMVVSILAREGQTATLSQAARESETTYTPSTGEVVGDIASTCSVKIILLDYGLVSNGLQSKAGTTITLDDKQCYMSPYDVDGNAFPKDVMPNDRLIVNGTTWNIITIKEYNPSGSSPIMYDLLIKR